MRDLDAALEYVMDPVTGSELNYDGYDTSKEGGTVYRFLFRSEPDVPVHTFHLLLSEYTSLEMDDYRASQGLPDFESSLERRHYRRDFAERFGQFFFVQELELAEETQAAGPGSWVRPGCWEVDWSYFSTEIIRSLIDALSRAIFLARSRRPEGNGFYPDHLTVKPYDMPGQFVVRRRANEFMEK